MTVTLAIKLYTVVRRDEILCAYLPAQLAERWVSVNLVWNGVEVVPERNVAVGECLGPDQSEVLAVAVERGQRIGPGWRRERGGVAYLKPRLDTGGTQTSTTVQAASLLTRS